MGYHLPKSIFGRKARANQAFKELKVAHQSEWLVRMLLPKFLEKARSSRRCYRKISLPRCWTTPRTWSWSQRHWDTEMSRFITWIKRRRKLNLMNSLIILKYFYQRKQLFLLASWVINGELFQSCRRRLIKNFRRGARKSMIVWYFLIRMCKNIWSKQLLSTSMKETYMVELWTAIQIKTPRINQPTHLKDDWLVARKNQQSVKQKSLPTEQIGQLKRRRWMVTQSMMAVKVKFPNCRRSATSMLCKDKSAGLTWRKDKKSKA